MRLHQQIVRMAGLAAVAAVLFSLLAACGNSPTTTRAKMGEKVTVAGLDYTVLGAEWLPAIGTPPESRVPENQFLVLRIAVANAGSGAAEMASMKLLADDGTEYDELANGQGIADWFGIVRAVNAQGNSQGSVLFDVPKGVYQLKMTPAGIDEDEGDTALVEIPVRTEGIDTPSSTEVVP